MYLDGCTMMESTERFAVGSRQGVSHERTTASNSGPALYSRGVSWTQRKLTPYAVTEVLCMWLQIGGMLACSSLFA